MKMSQKTCSNEESEGHHEYLPDGDLGVDSIIMDETIPLNVRDYPILYKDEALEKINQKMGGLCLKENFAYQPAEVLVNILSFMDKTTLTNIRNSSSIFEACGTTIDILKQKRREFCLLEIPRHILEQYELTMMNPSSPRSYDDVLGYWRGLSRDVPWKREMLYTYISNNIILSIYLNNIYLFDKLTNELEVTNLRTGVILFVKKLPLNKCCSKFIRSMHVWKPQIDMDGIHILLYEHLTAKMKYVIENGDGYELSYIKIVGDNPAFYFASSLIYIVTSNNADGNLISTVAVKKVNRFDLTTVGQYQLRGDLCISVRDDELMVLGRDKISIYEGLLHKKDICIHLKSISHAFSMHNRDGRIYLHNYKENNLYFLDEDKQNQLKLVVSNISEDHSRVYLKTNDFLIRNKMTKEIDLINAPVSIDQLIQSDGPTLDAAPFNINANFNCSEEITFVEDSIYILIKEHFKLCTLYRFHK